MNIIDEPHMGNPRGVRPAWVSRRLYPFESRFVELDGHTIHYVDEGPRSGPVLLWLHGNPVWSFEFRDVIQALAPAFRCVALDLPGFGLSSPAQGYGFLPGDHAEVLGRFIAALDLRDVVSYHHDWSGPIGFHAVGQQVERLRGLVIGGTWARPDIGGFQRLSSRMLDNALGRHLVRRRNVFIESFLNRGHERRKLAPDELEHYRRPFPDAVARDRHHLLNRSIVREQVFLTRVQRTLPRLAHLPVLFAWPEKDPAFPLGELQRLQQSFWRQRTVLLRGAGHFAPEDVPEQLVLAVRTWLRDLEQGHA